MGSLISNFKTISGDANKNVSLSEEEMEEIMMVSQNVFSEKQVLKLLKVYDEVDKDEPGVLDVDEFCNIESISINPLKYRIAECFHLNDGGKITFLEFCKTLSVFSLDGPIDMKRRFAFQMYDIDADGKISKDDLFQYLKVVTADVDGGDDGGINLLRKTKSFRERNTSISVTGEAVSESKSTNKNDNSVVIDISNTSTNKDDVVDKTTDGSEDNEARETIKSISDKNTGKESNVAPADGADTAGAEGASSSAMTLVEVLHKMVDKTMEEASSDDKLQFLTYDDFSRLNSLLSPLFTIRAFTVTSLQYYRHKIETLDEIYDIMTLERAQQNVENALKTFQSLQRFYRTNKNYRFIVQVENFRGEAESLLQLADIKRQRVKEKSTVTNAEVLCKGAESDLKTAQEIFMEIEDLRGVARVHKTKGQLLLLTKGYHSAKIELENGLDIAMDIEDTVLEHEFKSIIEEIAAANSLSRTIDTGDLLVKKNKFHKIFTKYVTPKTNTIALPNTRFFMKELCANDHELSDLEIEEFGKQLKQPVWDLNRYDNKKNEDAITFSFDQFWEWWNRS